MIKNAQMFMRGRVGYYIDFNFECFHRHCSLDHCPDHHSRNFLWFLLSFSRNCVDDEPG